MKSSSSREQARPQAESNAPLRVLPYLAQYRTPIWLLEVRADQNAAMHPAKAAVRQQSLLLCAAKRVPMNDEHQSWHTRQPLPSAVHQRRPMEAYREQAAYKCER